MFYFLAVASGLLMAAIGHAAQLFTSFTTLAIATPSGLAVFLLVFLFFDQFVWHLGWLRRFGIIKIPDIRGVWAGELCTSVDGFQEPIPVTLTVTQTYTRIRLRLDTETSFSRSHMASFEMIDPDRFHLRWEYFAEPKGAPAAADNGFRHYGVTLLRLSADKAQFKQEQEAEYYTEGDRDTSGRIALAPKER